MPSRLSLLAATAVLRTLGKTLNTMTLGGFAVALGVLVDDAIIGIENIMRRLARTAGCQPRPRLEVIVEASYEVRAPVIYATVVVIAVFLPELFSSSVQGHFVGPMALAFMCRRSRLAAGRHDGHARPVRAAVTPHARARRRWLDASLKGWQARAVHRCTGISVTILVLAALVVAAAATLPFLGGTFMPDFREEAFRDAGNASSAPEPRSRRCSTSALASSRDCSPCPSCDVEQQVGRAELGEDTWGPHQSEFHVELKADSKIDQAEAQDDLRKIVEQIPRHPKSRWSPSWGTASARA